MFEGPRPAALHPRGCSALDASQRKDFVTFCSCSVGVHQSRLKFTEVEARARFPDLVVASLGAQRKDKRNGVVSARVLFDGTHGPVVNTRTRIRDQERSADVSEAHRQVPVYPSDWRFLGCQIAKATVYMNTVGTFVSTSASYYWNRAGAAVGRISQYVVGDSAATWHMPVADDCHLEVGGELYRFALMTFFIVCAVVGVLLSWNKTSGGETVTWVGFELLHRTPQLGISQRSGGETVTWVGSELLRRTRQLGISGRSADWFGRWTTEVASSSSVQMASFEEGLGRVMYAAGALEYERPYWDLSTILGLYTRETRPGQCRHVFPSSSDTSQNISLCAGTTIAQRSCSLISWRRCSSQLNTDRHWGSVPTCRRDW